MINDASGKGFSVEVFASEIEEAANNQELITASTDATPQVWALKGKPAITSLLTEGIITVDMFPRDDYSYLSSTGSLALASVQNLIDLNPFFDEVQYRAIQIPPYSTSRSRQQEEEYKRLPKFARKSERFNYLTDNRVSKYYAEYGLGILASRVSAYYAGADSTSKRMEGHHSILKSMRMNGSVDPDISDALTDIRKQEKHSPEELFDGILELARLTTIAVVQNQTLAHRMESRSVRLRRAIRKKL